MSDDLRLALRRLRGSPGFTLAALLTLALAIGANAAILGVADVRGGAGAAVVSESAAAALWPGADPLERTLATASGRTLQVVGVAADVVMSLERAIPPPVYAAPGPQMGNMSLFARVRSRDAGTMTRVRGAVVAMAPEAPVTAGWWSERIDAITPFRQPRFQTLVLGGFGTLALGLTALGIFAAVAFVVASRTRELGVRMALGATPPSLVRLVVFEALLPVAGGVALGAIGVFWLRQLGDAYLVGLDTRDPSALGAAIVTVLVAALLAAWLPARRASRVDPAVVLRAE